MICVKWKPKHDQSLFIRNDQRVICSISNSNSFIDDFINNSTCPAHLEFYEIDFSDHPISFWELHGEKINSVKFSFCILELNTVSSIIKYCTKLETFGLRTSDSFIQTENPSFSEIFEYLVKQGRTAMSNVKTLEIVMNRTSLAPCRFDQTILNLLQIFYNFKNLTLKHNCDARNYSNYSLPTSSNQEVIGSRILWNNIFDLVKRKSHDLEGLNIELSSPLQINCVWQLALNRKIALKECR